MPFNAKLPELLSLQKLMEANPDNPFIRSALDGASEEFSPPPMAKEEEKKAFATGMPEDFTAPDISEATAGPSPTMEDESTKEEPGFWKKALGKVDWDDVGRGVAGAASIGLSRLGGEDFAQGFGESTLSGLQRNQAQKLQRRQVAWKDAYTQASSLPSEVFTDPQYADLKASQEALMKDLEDGSVDNEKNLANFLTQKSMASASLEEGEVDRKLDLERTAKDRQFTEDIERQQQQVTKWREVAENPEMYDSKEVAFAEERLSKGGRMVDTPNGPRWMTLAQELQQYNIDARLKETASQNQFNRNASNRRAAQGDRGMNMLEEHRKNQRKQGTISSAARMVNSNVQKAMKSAEKLFLESQGPPGEEFNPEQTRLDALHEEGGAIEAALDISLAERELPGLSGGTEKAWVATMGGKKIPLDFDPTTPEGKDQLLEMAWSILSSHSTGDLSLTGGLGGAF